jgi:hypothetical protein
MKYVSKMTTTTWFIIITALVWLAYDVAMYLAEKETISEVITRASYYSPMVPFIVGLLCGHWFWTSEIKD